jgi:nitrate/TMAO reductase-like tetraheme cytochrome c subunit
MVELLKRRPVRIALGGLVVAVVVGLLVLEPITRNVVAKDGLCSYCHVATEYRAEVRLSYSKHHPSAKTEDYETKQARCVDCHLEPGLIGSVMAYTHFASLTDLFGGFRYRTAERAGAWLPPRQAAAYRVRDGLLENDSKTCRSCHIESEIKPKRERGVNAHKKALDEKRTCIECHYNEKHRSVDLRDGAFSEAT